jgi:transcriptional regulator EpsA
MRPPPAQDRQPEWSALLDALHLESLMLNLDASLRVYERTHFFTWTQGMLQSLIGHKVLVCALRRGDSPSLRIDSFSTLVADAAIFGELLLQDASVVPRLITAWKEQQLLPMTCEAGDVGPLSGAAFARELRRIGAAQLVVHGVVDADGEAGSLFLFAREPQALGRKQSYVLQLVVPFLHAAWVRSQVNPRVNPRSEGARLAPARPAVLTAREKEILRWIYLGKSNGEVGTILAISPLTVKNHVQKILRKLGVVNRAQAVGKALEARMLMF